MEDILIEGVTCCYNKLGEHPVFRRRVHLNILNFLILCCLISFMFACVASNLVGFKLVVGTIACYEF
uniref:Uncharacterized protein n=1 Tax=Helianthus annuus TaxID=4232 RepID=A0A251USU6_HELAN